MWMRLDGQLPTMELCTAASHFLSRACGCRTSVTARQGRTGEPPFHRFSGVNEVPVAETTYLTSLRPSFVFLGLTATFLARRRSNTGEEVWVGFAVYEYIVDVYFAYLVDKAVEDLVLHTALKVRASSFQYK